MRGRALVLVLAVLSPRGETQGKPSPPGGTDRLQALQARAKELEERLRRIEEARIRIDLGLPVDRNFLRSLAPRGAEDPAVLRDRYAKELDALANLRARLRDLKVQAVRVPASTVRRRPKVLPAEVKPRPAPPRGSGAAPKAGEKKPKKGDLEKPRDRGKAQVYQVRVDPRLLADAFYRKGDYRKALDLYGGILSVRKNDTAALFRRALCLERLGERDKAMEILGKIQSEKAGSPWERAARFALENILWKKHFDSLGPLPSPPGPETGKAETGKPGKGR